MALQTSLFASPAAPIAAERAPEPAADALTWKEILRGEREADYFKKILSFVEAERGKGKRIYPPLEDVFNALKFTAFCDVKAVIIGQDPYHGPGQAHGLCFSVRENVPFPPSLQNIFQELRDDLGIPAPAAGCLEKWATQGVLLLNTVLTVEEGNPGSHANLGWETFTDRVIKELNERRQGIVFLLWGAHAQKKGASISPLRHSVLKAPHPSPLSAHRGFFGCRHFSKCNEILERQGVAPIDWRL